MKRVSPEQKEKILQESYEKGCVVTKLAKKHGVPEGTIYGWRGKKQQEINNSQESPAKFIEVHVKENVASTKLKKVELIYEKFRMEIEGEISSAKIAPIMQILEGE